MIGSRLDLVERAGELAEVAALGVAAGVDIGRQLSLVVGGVVGGAAGDIEHGGPVGGDGVVGTGIDAPATL